MIEVKNLTKYYGKGESRFKVLDNINLKIAQGDFAVILGASGSGKSTLRMFFRDLKKPTAEKFVWTEKIFAV